MSENTTADNSSSDDAKKSKNKKSLTDQLTFWIGIIGSIVTLSLTIWNAHTKTQIDAREENLKALEVQLQARSTGVEESKERVERYKWVYSLFPVLSGKNENEKNFTINLIRLALTNDEAEQLFTGLQTSNDTTLQSVGQTGIAAIQNEPISFLVSKINAATSDIRKNATGTLEKDYKSSSQAITLVLRMYDADKIKSLSPSGLINGLYYLSRTDPASWDKQQVKTARQLISNVERIAPGNQTKAELTNLKSLLQKVESN